MIQKTPLKRKARNLHACPCAISPNSVVKVHLYERSAIVEWAGQRDVSHKELRSCSTRNTITDMSSKSAKRLLFCIANAPKQWGVMVTLTFRVCPEWPKDIFREWVRKMQKQGLCREGWAWVMEFQRRGVIHFHVLFCADVLQRTGLYQPRYIRSVQRNGSEVSLLRGPFDDRVCDAWITSVGDCESSFINFQRGGICEVLRTTDGAARYFAAYCSKKEQKTLPDWLKGCGRWWYVSPDQAPKETATATLTHWPFLIPFACVFDKAELDGCLTDVQTTAYHAELLARVCPSL